MKLKLFREDQILDMNFRARVIKEIQSAKNKKRKEEAKKRHEIYKDNTVKWVMLRLQSEGLSEKTLKLMENRAANVSICRKVVSKLARCYKGGVKRDTGNDAANVLVTELASMLDFDQQMKKADRFCQLFKNTLPMLMPEAVRMDGEKKIFRMKMRVLAPWQYDVVPDAKDNEQIGCLVLSDYVDEVSASVPVSANSTTSLGLSSTITAAEAGGACSFIWWSENYHFTTNDKGQIINEYSPELYVNPIKMIPGVTIAEDQDGEYWADGGQDLTDGSVLVNTLLTDMFAIAYMQGWGQLVISGKKIPQHYQVGPHTALVLEYEEGDPKPEVSVVNPNPPLDAWMKSIEQYVALLLSTNNLSPSNVSVKLDVQNAASGIAMLIEKSEATGSIEDRQTKFRAGERKLWEIEKRWHNVLLESQSLDQDFADLGKFPEEISVSTNFNDTKEVATEGERLDNLKKRKDLGLNTELELLMLDRPGMTEEEAKKKLLEIKAERVEQNVSDASKVVDQMQQQQEQPQP